MPRTEDRPFHRASPLSFSDTYHGFDGVNASTEELNQQSNFAAAGFARPLLLTGDHGRSLTQSINQIH